MAPLLSASAPAMRSLVGNQIPLTLVSTMEYCIAGSFHMVQNFAFFTDRLGAVKIRTAKSGENMMSYMQSIDVGVVST
jgi:hypothetical protein